MPRLARAISSFSRDEISALFKAARTKVQEQGLKIRIAPKTKEFGRILIVIPKRSGNAALRNRVRRRLKSIFYEERLFEGPNDYLIFVGKEAINLPFSELKDILSQVHEAT